MREGFLEFALPDVGDDELEALSDVLRSGWLTNGSVTRRFENEFAEVVGAKYAVAVNSCTAALHLALEAVGVEREDVVITTPFTFAATAEVIRYFDARPEFVDIEPRTLNICPVQLHEKVRQLREKHGRKVKAIIPVHLAGHACDMDAIVAIAREYKLALIEDAAHAFPALYKGRPIGRCADDVSSACTFSFYPTKPITTGEGGMITTENKALADRCRMMSLHGISKDAWKRYSAVGKWQYEVIEAGFKYNMTDLAAAIGLAQLRKARKMLCRRREIALRYQEAFSGLSGLELPEVSEDVDHSWHLYIIRLIPSECSVSRDKFIKELGLRNIGTSVHFIPLHTQPYYRHKYNYRNSDFPEAFGQFERVVSLPIYSKMDERDVTDVIKAVTDVLDVRRAEARS